MKKNTTLAILTSLFLLCSMFGASISMAQPGVAKQIQQVDEQVEMVDINFASADLLTTLPGIGPKTAEQIINYRTENGSFSNIEQLIEVKGIGEKKLARIKPFVHAGKQQS
ncbi:MAG: helix-hairpin-helix domain-containing protein [Thermodesulfobacteriota bacterium]